MMVASAVFGLTVMGFVYCQMFGMRQDQLVNSKIGASEQARLSFNDLANDIRAAKIWQIGNGDLSSFTGIPLGTNQQGNALKLSLTTDTNQLLPLLLRHQRVQAVPRPQREHDQQRAWRST